MRDRAVAIVAATPAIALALASVAWLVMAPMDAHPFWSEQPMTLSEAAALHDGGEVARLIAMGQDPDGRYAVREGILDGSSRMMTPVEAAVAARRPEIVDILVDAGASPP